MNLKRAAHHLFAKNEDQVNDAHAQIILVGQPNCGKSTVFNQAAGYRSVSSNFPGATVELTHSHVNIQGQVCDLVDMPGTYSLTSVDTLGAEAQHYLLTQPADVIINVVDASVLSRSLELTIQLLELEKPLVLCLNMVDEAERKGIRIDEKKLAASLGIPVVKTIASRGIGVEELMTTALQVIRAGTIPRPIRPSRHVELVIQKLNRLLSETIGDQLPFSKRLLAVKLIEGDKLFTQKAIDLNGHILPSLSELQRQLALAHGRPADVVISSERHSLAMNIFEASAIVTKTRRHWRDRVDDILMRNFLGYFFMFAILFLFFAFIFKIGALLEGPLVAFLNHQLELLARQVPTSSLEYKILAGALQGIGGGIGIVLPYLVPFLIGLALLEDIGYLPRVAFLMDGLMHRLGLHGTAVIPVVLGYGCSVPAVMATRILNTPRDRFIASVIAILAPCSARMTVIFGLVGYYLGGVAAFAIYLLNIIVIAITGAILSRLLKEDSPGLLIEMPKYHFPIPRVIISKTWLRMKDFIILAWPLLIVGSMVLSLAEYYHLEGLINRFFYPITALLGLPEAVGTTLIFGILRKELSMLMLMQALGTTDVATVLSPVQLLVFTVFVVFYIPCLATIGILAKEVGLKRTLYATLFTLILALAIALIARGLGVLLG